MTPITDEELDELCILIRDAAPPFYEVVASFVNDLYNTGCRPMELLQVDRWELQPSSPPYYTMQPGKGNFLRAILQSDISTDLQEAIQFNYKPYQDLTLRQLEFSMKQVNPAGKCYHMTKEMVSYLFRYNRCKILVNDGIPDSGIQEYFGWYNPGMPWSYGSSVIEVTNYIW